MKKIILLLFFIPIFCFGQQKLPKTIFTEWVQINQYLTVHDSIYVGTSPNGFWLSKYTWSKIGSSLGYIAENIAHKGMPNGYASLDANGLIPSENLPSLVISNTYVDASMSEMLSGDRNIGDISVRSDSSKTLILKQTPSSVRANWVLLQTPSEAPVQSVNSKTGNVVLDHSDIGIPSLESGKVLSNNGSSMQWNNIGFSDITGLPSDNSSLYSVLSSKEPTISTGSTSQFWRGDKTFSQVSLINAVTDSLPISKGGIGATTANKGLNNLLPSQSGNSNKFLTTNGINSSWQNLPTTIDSTGILKNINGLIKPFFNISEGKFYENTNSLPNSVNKKLCFNGQFIPTQLSIGSSINNFTSLNIGGNQRIYIDQINAGSLQSYQNSSSFSYLANQSSNGNSDLFITHNNVPCVAFTPLAMNGIDVPFIFKSYNLLTTGSLLTLFNQNNLKFRIDNNGGIYSSDSVRAPLAYPYNMGGGKTYYAGSGLHLDGTTFKLGGKWGGYDTIETVQLATRPGSNDYFAIGTTEDIKLYSDENSSFVGKNSVGWFGVINDSLIVSVNGKKHVFNENGLKLDSHYDTSEWEPESVVTKEWVEDRIKGGGSSYTFSQSLVNNSGTISLSGDQTSPGNNYLYGTNSSGVKGWYSQPTSATWGNITGTFSNQTDAYNLVQSKVPYSGAYKGVSLGTHWIATTGWAHTSDTTKLIKLSHARIPTATTVIMTVPNRNITLDSITTATQTGITGVIAGNGGNLRQAIAADFPTLNQNTTGTAHILPSDTSNRAKVMTRKTSDSLYIKKSALIGNIGEVINGNGYIAATGVYDIVKIDYDCTITGWTIMETSATPISTTTIVDVWKSQSYPPSVANTIFGTKPSLTSSTINSATGLNISVSAGDNLVFYLESNNAAKKLTFQFTILR